MKTKDIALIGVMIAIIEVCKVALAWAPNIEVTSFWIIIFSIYFTKQIFYAIPIFILIEGAIYGFGLWWVMYLYAWPLLTIVCRMFKKMNSAISWSILSGGFGLLFGLLCAIPYIFIGAAGTSFISGLKYAFGWWIAGIPFDITHGIGNFVIMLILYHPITRVMKKIEFLHE